MSKNKCLENEFFGCFKEASDFRTIQRFEGLLIERPKQENLIPIQDEALTAPSTPVRKLTV